MRELERDSSSALPCARLAVVGAGPVGRALAAGLRRAGLSVDGPLGRGADGTGAQAVILAVPDREIASAAAAVTPGPLVGHCSGATPLSALLPHEAFALHPLMTFAATADPESPAEAASGGALAGVGAAIGGTTPRALALARRLAEALAMRPVVVADDDRAAYHAAASIASNFLITLEGAAERILATAGVERSLLVPLVRATVENWAALGAQRALTGPVARGDEATVDAQREAVAGRAPELLELFDALAEATRALAEATRELAGAPAVAGPLEQVVDR